MGKLVEQLGRILASIMSAVLDEVVGTDMITNTSGAGGLYPI
jgi:hypothetical protein